MNDHDRRLERHRRRATAIYALLLRLYPGAYRQAFGEQMLQTFRDHYHDAAETRGESAMRFWLAVIADEGKSLIVENGAAVRERAWAMNRLLVGVPVAGLLVIGLLLVYLPGRRSPQNPGVPMSDPIWRPILEMAMLLLTLALYASLVAAIVQFARNVLRSGYLSGWLRLGLTLGGIFSLYLVVSNVLGVFLPAPDDNGQFGRYLLGTLPLLLTGVAGMIGGYRSGRIRTGVFAGLLTGFLTVIADQTSSVLGIALAWLAIQHHFGPAGIANDYLSFMRNTGYAPDLGTYISLEYLQDGVGLPIFFSLIALTLDGLCAALGGWIGASLSHVDRPNRAGQPLATLHVPAVRPASFILLALALDLLVWATTVEFNALGGAKRLLGMGDLGSSFVSQSFGLWLLGFLVVLAFVLISARPLRRTAAAAA